MSVLVIATSPLQIQNSIQYITQHGLEFSNAVLAHVESTQQEDNARTRSLAGRHDWKCVASFPPFHTLRSEKFPDSFSWEAAERGNRAEYIRSIGAFFESVGSTFDRILLGDYRPMSFRQFLQFTAHSAPEIVLLDDGSISRYVMRYRDTGSENEEVVRGLIPSLGTDDPFKVMEPSSLTYFTIYDETIAQNDRIVENRRFEQDEFSGLKKLEDEVWICGTNHVEAKIAHDKEYRELCYAIREWFPQKVIRYFPHRREGTDKVKGICERIVAQIDDFKFGIEEYVAHTRSRPHKLVVFGSTAADTLSRIFRESEAVMVVVPRDSYFTDSSRARHVKNVIIDNIRTNPGVPGLSVDVDNAGRWLSSRHYWPSSAEILTPAVVPEQTPFVAADGLDVETMADGWTRFTETETFGLHRVILADIPRLSLGQAGLHIFRIRCEERYGFKLRMVRRGNTRSFVEVRGTLDRPGLYKKTNRLGHIAVEVEVHPDRTATVSVFSRARWGSATRLHLLALSDGEKKTRYDGVAGSGFSLATFEPTAPKTQILPLSSSDCACQVAVTPKSTGLMLIRREAPDAVPVLILLHRGILGSFDPRRLYAPSIGKGEAYALRLRERARLKGTWVKKSNLILNRVLITTSSLLFRRGWFSKMSLGTSRLNRITMTSGGDMEIAITDFRSGRKLVLSAYDSPSTASETFGLLY